MKLRLVLLALLGALFVVSFPAPASAAPQCDPATPLPSPLPVRTKQPVPITANVDKTPVIKIGYGNRSGDADVVFRGDLPDGPLWFEAGRFRKDSQRLDSRVVFLTVERLGEDVVSVDLCIDRNIAKVQGGGQYTGVISVRDPRLTAADVPVVIDIQDYRIGWIGAIELSLAATLATLGIWVTRRRAAGQPTFGDGAGADFGAWAKVNMIFTVVVAAVAAWVVFRSLALGVSDFAGSVSDYANLFLAMFGAAYTAGNVPPAISGKEGAAEAPQ